MRTHNKDSKNSEGALNSVNSEGILKKETKKNKEKHEESQASEPTEETSEASTEATAEATTPASALEKEKKELQEQLNKAKSDNLYLLAEFENYKKQAIKARSDYMRFGSERLIVELLDVLDNFQRALEIDVNAEDKGSVEGFKKGMELTATEFRTALKKFNVEEITCLGEPFDPTYHEALGSEESDEVEPGHITNVLKGAYKLHDRVIRPAQVIIAKEKSTS